MGAGHKASYTLGDAGKAIVRRRRRIILVTLLFLVLGSIYTLAQERKYRSEGKLYVRLGRENVMLDPTVNMGDAQVVAIPQTRVDEINSVVEVLSSDSLVAATIDKLGAEYILEDADGPATAASEDGFFSGIGEKIRGFKRQLAEMPLFKGIGPLVELTPPEEALRTFHRRMDVSAVKNSNVIRVTYDGATPERSQKIVSVWLDCYLDEHVKMNRNSGSHDFLATQAGRQQEGLKSLESQLLKLRNDAGVIAMGDQRKQLIDRMGRLQDALVDRSTALAASQAKVDDLKRSLKTLPEMVTTGATAGYGNDGTDAMRNQLYALQLKLGEMESEYTADHPQVIQIRKQVAEAKALLAKETADRTQTTQSRSPTYDTVRLALLTEEPLLQSLRAESGELTAQLTELRTHLDKLNETDMKVTSLERELALKETSYKNYSVSLEKSRIDEALEKERISNISLVQAATLDRKPVSPKLSLNLILALFLGSVTGMFWSLAKEYFDDSLKGPADLEKDLGIPVFASIPRLGRKEMVIHGGR